LRAIRKLKRRAILRGVSLPAEIRAIAFCKQPETGNVLHPAL
jgi:hypothetical protein